MTNKLLVESMIKVIGGLAVLVLASVAMPNEMAAHIGAALFVVGAFEVPFRLP